MKTDSNYFAKKFVPPEFIHWTSQLICSVMMLDRSVGHMLRPYWYLPSSKGILDSIPDSAFLVKSIETLDIDPLFAGKKSGLVSYDILELLKIIRRLVPVSSYALDKLSIFVPGPQNSTSRT